MTEQVEERTATGTGSKPRQFFVQVERKSDGKKLFVGPIDDKEDSENQAESLQNMFSDEFNFESMGKIEARRNGMRSEIYEDSINTLASEFPVEDEIWNNIPAEEEKTKRGRPRKGEGDQPIVVEPKHKPASTPTSEVKKKVAASKQVVHRVPATLAQKRKVIVTNRSGEVSWLERRGIVGEIITRVTNPSQVQGALVFGILPPWWAAEAEAYYVIDMKNLRSDQKGTPLTPEEMDRAGAKLRKYVTHEEESEF
jgi:putative CRISPR-associated protein (TIGR02620 family)